VVESFCRFIDNANEWSGRLVSWLFIPLTFMVVTDVFTRYVLNEPWYYIDINVQIMGIITALGLGYCHLHDGHVSVDILITHLSAKKKAILEFILFPLFLGALCPLLWQLAVNMVAAVQSSQRYVATIDLPVYPYKIILVAGFSLLLLQGLSKLIRNLRIAFPAKSGGNP